MQFGVGFGGTPHAIAEQAILVVQSWQANSAKVVAE